MRIPPYDGPKLHDADETAKIHYFILWIFVVYQTRKVEKLCSLINLCPKSLLQSLFRSL